MNGPDLAHRITGDSFYAWDGDVLVLNVLGKPAAARDAIGKVHGTQLKVSVTAAPEAGRATDHMLRIRSPKRLPAVLAEAAASAAVEL